MIQIVRYKLKTKKIQLFSGNQCINIITLFVSLVLVCSSFVTKQTTKITSILEGIGCSGIAAALVAVFLERQENRKLKTKINSYFSNLHENLKLAIEHLIWLSDRFEDNKIEWNLPIEKMISYKFNLSESDKARPVSMKHSDAVSKLVSIGEKFSLNNISHFRDEEVEKISKLFTIVLQDLIPVMKELNSLKSNALTLQTLDYLSQEELDQLIFDLSLSVTIMSRKDKNYNVAVLKLKSAFSTIHNKGKFSNSDFNIGFNTFSVPFSDL